MATAARDRKTAPTLLLPVCDFPHRDDTARPLFADEYVLDTPVVRDFVAEARAGIRRAHSPEEACELLRPLVAGLLDDRSWLPAEYQEPAAESGQRVVDGLLYPFFERHVVVGRDDEGLRLRGRPSQHYSGRVSPSQGRPTAKLLTSKTLRPPTRGMVELDG